MTDQSRDNRARADSAYFQTVIQGRRTASESFRTQLANHRVPERRIAKVWIIGSDPPLKEYVGCIWIDASQEYG